MEKYRFHTIQHEDELKAFFEQPKALQRFAFTDSNADGIPTARYTDIIVTDDYAILEMGHTAPSRGLHGIYPRRTITFRWYYSAKSKRINSLSMDQKGVALSLLRASDRYEWTRELPPDALSGTVLKDILYGKITNARDAIIKYGKSIGVKHMSAKVFDLAFDLNKRPIILLAVINPAQLETCYESLKKRLSASRHLRRTFGDMIDQAYALEEHINLMWLDKRMQDQHTEWSRRLMRLSVNTKSPVPIWCPSIVDAFKAEGLELINDEQRAYEEGYCMHHCLYTNYWRIIKTKEYLAFSIDLPTGPATIGVRLYDDSTRPRRRRRRVNYPQPVPTEVSSELPRFEYDQCYHKFDACCTDEEMDIVMEKLKSPAVTKLFEEMAQISVGERLITQYAQVEEEPEEIPLPW